MGALWVAKGPAFLQSENEDTDQSVRMRRMICIFAILGPDAGYRLIMNWPMR